MKICLIGSTRFMDQYLEVNRQLSMAGHVVYSVATRSSSAAYEKSKDTVELTEDEKETLDLVHLLKIQNSDVCVLITDAAGYVGTSTKREIKWAQMMGKQVLLPHHIKDFKEITTAFYEWLRKDLLDQSALHFKGKMHDSKIKI
jgi:hypothetical protein